jgi:hypothetical protein
MGRFQNKYSWLEATHPQITKVKIDEYESKGIALTYDGKSVKPKKGFQHALQKPFDHDKELKKNLNLATMELIVDGTKYVFYKIPKFITMKGQNYELSYSFYIWVLTSITRKLLTTPAWAYRNNYLI